MRQHSGRKGVAFAVVIVGALAALGLGALATVASPAIAGDFVRGDASDAVVVLTGLAAASACAVDEDGDAAYDAGEPVLVDTDSASCATNTEAGDLRLTPGGGQPGGTLVRTADPDFNRPVLAVNDDVRFYDANGDGVLDAGDTAYLDVVDPAGGRVDVGDVRLASNGVFTALDVVTAGASDLNLGLAEVPASQGGPRDLADGGALRFHDADANGLLGAADTAYATLDALGDAAEPGDLRLMAAAGLAAGRLLGRTDADVAAEPLGLPAASLCAIDADGDGAYDAGEVLVVDADSINCVTNTEVNDLRLSGPNAGTLVRAGDADHDVPVLSVNDDVKYFDANGNNVLDRGDTAYIDIVATANNRVDVGDLRLTAASGAPGGTAVSVSDADINRALFEVSCAQACSRDLADAGAVALHDGGDGLLSPGDTVYLRIDAAGSPEVGDVRLTAFAGGDAFQLLGVGSGDLVHTLTSIAAHGACAIDEDGDGAYDAGEPVFVDVDSSTCATNTEANDVRLTPSGGLAGGTIIRTSDADFNRPALNLAFSDNVRYYDANGDAAADTGDTIYLDLVSPASNRVDVGDVRLTAFGSTAGLTTVAASDGDLNLALQSTGLSAGADEFGDVASLAYFDANGDVVFGVGDALYWNRDGVAPGAALATAAVRAGDVRLTSLPGGGGGGGMVPPQPSDLQAQLNALIAQNAALNAQLNETLAQNAQLSQQVADLQAQIAALNQRIAELNAQLSQQSQQLTALYQQVAQLLQENERLRAELENRTANQPPVAVIAPVPPVECFGGRGFVLLNGSASHDPEGAPLRYAWQAFGGRVADPRAPSTLANFTLGDHGVALSVDDGQLVGMAVAPVRVQDTLPPRVGVERVLGQAGERGWFRGPLEIGFAAADQCGVDRIAWSATTYAGNATSSVWHEGDAAFVWQDGHHSVEAYVWDLGGNFGRTDERARFFSIDATPPSSRLLAEGHLGEAGWWTSEVTVFADVADATSGVFELEVTVDGATHRVPVGYGGSPLGWGPLQAKVPVALLNVSGEHRVTVRAIDAAGNADAPRDIVVRIDREAPATRATLGGTEGLGGWWRSAVTVSLAASDAHSGVAAVFASVDGAPFERADRVVVRGDGPHDVTYYAVDRAGNVEGSRSVSLRIDATAPRVRLDEPAEDTLHLFVFPVALPVRGSYVVGLANVTGEGDDVTSGVDRIELWVDGRLRGAAVPNGSAGVRIPWASFDEAAGEHVVELRAVDRAGNDAFAGRDVVTVPLTPQGVLASGSRCEAVLSERLCDAVPGAPGSFGEACALAFSDTFCAAPGLLCREVLAERLCGAATDGGMAAAPRLPDVDVAARPAPSSRP